MYALSLFAGSLLNALTKSVWTWICCGWPPAPRPTNQRMTWPPFGPGTLVERRRRDERRRAGMAAAGGSLAAGRRGWCAVDAVVPPQAAARMAMMPSDREQRPRTGSGLVHRDRLLLFERSFDLVPRLSRTW